MPFKNYITEEELKAYLPELSKLLWSDEVNYSKQMNEAVNTVISDLVYKGYDPTDLMPQLVLRSSGSIITANETGESVPETAARSRFIYNVVSISSIDDKSITLEGSYNNSEWTAIDTFTVTGTGQFTKIITSLYKYYRVKAVVTGGSLDYSAYLAETTYDRLISAKWLELILLDRYTEENDHYHLKMKYFRSEYEKLWDSIRFWSDKNNDGSIQASESNRTASIRMLK